MNLPSFFFGPPKRIHLIGVAGSGMSGIAALLLALRHHVSGSDREETIEVVRLCRHGLTFSAPNSAEQVHGADLVIYSSAVKPGNPSYDEAMRLGMPMVKRADALAAIMTHKKGIIICGMHGKTTTSAMCAYVLRAAGLKPSHYVGAEIPILGTNAHWDSEGDLFVAEGDESDGSLVQYHPHYSIVLNVEPEHLDHYKNLDEIDAVYRQLITQTKERVLYCRDDAGATRVTNPFSHTISYGSSSDAIYQLTNLQEDKQHPVFTVLRNGTELGSVELGIPGRHNALNALAVIGLAMELGVDFEVISQALTRFRGAKRRFEILYEDNDYIVVDDYGHHPTEIAATLQTARSRGRKRILALFQPHRFTRTQALQNEFGNVLSSVDKLVVTDIYPASEPPIPGITGQTIIERVREHHQTDAIYEASATQAHKAIGPHLQSGDLILSLGAGNIHEAGVRLAEDLRMRAQLQAIIGHGTIKLYEPLSLHTTIRVGGPAQFWVEPETEEGFADLVRFCFDEQIPLMVMGRGSNLLVRDGGIPGVVAHLVRGKFADFAIDGHEITAGVGVRLKQLCGIARKAGLTGFEWMEGIPGNLGGSLRMNAGAMGLQTFDQVTRVRYCDQNGNIFTKSPEQMEIHYRSVPMFTKNYALSATLRGEPAEIASIENRITQAENKRRSSQPIAASAGCIFKNPQEIPAGKLVEELGLKNARVGAARVSEVHGNFIVNEGGATASDILTLIEKIQAEAKLRRGIQLETEVQIVGEERQP